MAAPRFWPAELADVTQRPVETVETGEPLTMRVLARIKSDLDDPIVGFLIRNRHGISAYGTNTKEQQIEFGAVRRGDLLEVDFFFQLLVGRRRLFDHLRSPQPQWRSLRLDRRGALFPGDQRGRDRRRRQSQRERQRPASGKRCGPASSERVTRNSQSVSYGQ